MDSFDLKIGRRIGPHYEVSGFLGKGSEGEVYQLFENATGIHRAAKFYFGKTNPSDKAVIWYAKKLHRLRDCPIVLQYYHTQSVRIRNRNILCLVSEFCEGIPLEEWIRKQPGKRLHPYLAVRLFYELVKGIERVHAAGEYHGDVHSGNILVSLQGVRFHLKLVDFYNWGPCRKYKQQQDIVDCVHVLYECLGGQGRYGKQIASMRFICSGLKRTLILKRFPTISALRLHLENFNWQS